MKQPRNLWDGIKLGVAMLTGATFLGAVLITAICIPPGLGVSPNKAGLIFALHVIIGAIMGGAGWKLYKAFRRNRLPKNQTGSKAFYPQIPSWSAPPPLPDSLAK